MAGKIEKEFGEILGVLLTCSKVPCIPSQNWVFPRESPVTITKFLKENDNKHVKKKV